VQNGQGSSPHLLRGPLRTVDAPKAEEMKGVAATKAANRGEKTLQQLYAEHDGKVSDKWSLYLAEYERIFAPYRDRPVRILEIGIENGGSLELWSKYFWNASKIVGCDINRDCAQLQYDDPRISIVVGNTNRERTRRRILQHCNGFDIIIDDASHQSKDIICSFANYFPCLSDGGLYVVEDLHCSYWQEFTGGLYHPGSSLAFFKLLVDVVNREHWGLDKARSELMLHLEEHYQLHFTEALLRKVHSLEFLNSLCFIKKQDDQNNVLGPRVVSGRTEAIAPIRLLNGTRSAQPDQRGNKWTRPQNIDERTVLRAERLHVELGVIGKQLAEKEAALARVTGERDALGQTIEAMAAAHSDETERLRADLSVAVKQLAEKEAALACIVGERDTLVQTAEAAAAVHAGETQPLRDEIGVVSDQLARAEARLNERFGETATLSNLLREQENATRRVAHDTEWMRQTAAVLLGGGGLREKFAGLLPGSAVQALRKIRLKRRGLFDPKAYLKANPDVARFGADPLRHYVNFGTNEGRTRG
jgi:hypothetical protein